MKNNQKDEPCGSRNLGEKEERIAKLTKNAVKPAYPIYWKGLNLLKDVINLLIKDATENKKERSRKYSIAYLLLINRSIQHIESMRLLTERGLYGDSFVLMRCLESDLSMMQYLHFHPELLDLFLNEKQEDYQTNKEFKRMFSEGAVERDLSKRGVTPFGTSFQILSKASHASSFGSQFFGSRGAKDGQYYLNYGPKFQPEKALMIIDLIAVSNYDLINSVLWHRYHAGEDLNTAKWNRVKAGQRGLKGQVNILSEVMKKTIQTLWPELKNA